MRAATMQTWHQIWLHYLLAQKCLYILCIFRSKMPVANKSDFLIISVGHNKCCIQKKKQIHFHVDTPFGYHFRSKGYITIDDFGNNITVTYHFKYYQWHSKISLQFRLNSMTLENYFIVKDEIRHGKLFIACLKEPYCDPLFDHKVVAVEHLLSPWHSHTILFQRITIPNKNSCQVRWNWRSLLTFVYLSIPWIILIASSDILLST